MNLKENKKPMHIILEEVAKVTGVSKGTDQVTHQDAGGG